MQGDTEIVVVDVFHQAADDGIPAHWCCQFVRDGWADYEYFSNSEDAYNFAYSHGFQG